MVTFSVKLFPVNTIGTFLKLFSFWGKIGLLDYHKEKRPLSGGRLEGDMFDLGRALI